MLRKISPLLCVSIILSLDAYDTVAPGVRYLHMQVSTPVKQSIHILSIDPKKVQLQIGLAHDICASSETTSAMSKRRKAVAAINGGFFEFGCQTRLAELVTIFLDMLGYSNYRAYPMYSLKMGGRWISISSIHTGVCGWRADEATLIFDTIKTECDIKLGTTKYHIDELNKVCTRNNILYTPAYGASTPRVRNVTEIIIEHDRVSKVLSGSSGNTLIPQQGYVLVMRSALKQAVVHEGDPVTITYNSTRLDGTDTTKLWDNTEYLVASTPLLMKKGQIVSSLMEKTSDFYVKRHPRTAIGVQPNGRLVLVVADGRRRSAKGFTILELASFMKDLGCIHALNFDGGGSSTMVLGNNVVNRPSGREYGLSKKERPISTALLVMPRDH